MKLYREFFSYVIPSLLAFALSGVYCIVDGFFVGNSIGDVGLTTINIAYPVVALLQAAGTGIGMGGAVHYSIRLAAGKKGRRRRDTQTALYSFSWPPPSSPPWSFTWPPRLSWRRWGPSGHILDLGKLLPAHHRPWVCVPRSSGTGLVPLIATWAALLRHDDHGGGLSHKHCAGLRLCVGPAPGRGRCGPGYPHRAGGDHGRRTPLFPAQGRILPPAPLCLLLRKGGRTPRRHCEDRAVPLRVSAFSPTIHHHPHEPFLMDYWREKAAGRANGLHRVRHCHRVPAAPGCGDGCQPLISRYYGEDQAKSMKKVCSLAYLSGVLIAAACMLLIFLTRYQIGGLFGASDQVRAEAGQVLPCFLISPRLPGLCAGHDLRLLRHGKDVPVLHPGVCGAGVPLPSPSFSAAAGRSYRRVAEHPSCPDADLCDSACL